MPYVKLDEGIEVWVDQLPSGALWLDAYDFGAVVGRLWNPIRSETDSVKRTRECTGCGDPMLFCHVPQPGLQYCASCSPSSKQNPEQRTEPARALVRIGGRLWRV